mmetsp:Transcript_95769/g.205479  ORF Transcript_95769/g.205479 Transcript_95769/m.205479 type:complete len:268 (+) Transcript_95769:66-869(+)
MNLSTASADGPWRWQLAERDFCETAALPGHALDPQARTRSQEPFLLAAEGREVLDWHGAEVPYREQSTGPRTAEEALCNRRLRGAAGGAPPSHLAALGVIVHQIQMHTAPEVLAALWLRKKCRCRLRPPGFREHLKGHEQETQVSEEELCLRPILVPHRSIELPVEVVLHGVEVQCSCLIFAHRLSEETFATQCLDSMPRMLCGTLHPGHDTVEASACVLKAAWHRGPRNTLDDLQGPATVHCIREPETEELDRCVLRTAPRADARD